MESKVHSKPDLVPTTMFDTSPTKQAPPQQNQEPTTVQQNDETNPFLVGFADLDGDVLPPPPPGQPDFFDSFNVFQLSLFINN